MLTQTEVRRLFNYDPFTGILTNKIDRGHKAKAGKEAGFPNTNGYLLVGINYKLYYVHRLIWLWVYGVMPNQIDHIEGNVTDNRLHMLCDGTRQDNGHNQKLPCTNTSGHIGVSWYKRVQKWAVQIAIKGKNVHLGYFEDIDDAIKAREEANIKYGFHKNHGRKK